MVYFCGDNFLYCPSGNSCADNVSVQAQVKPVAMGCTEDRKRVLRAASQLSGT